MGESRVDHDGPGVGDRGQPGGEVDGGAEDIAEAVYWLASDRAAKSTGNMINVDAGNALAFTR